jgi:hypothetical protein
MFYVPTASAAITKAPNNLGLAIYLSMNEGTSTMVGDFSGNNNFGTTSNMSNPATATSGWTSGKHGKALNFDGVDDYITMSPGASTAIRGGEYTISFWVKDNFQSGEFFMDTSNVGETQRFVISLNGGNWAGNQKAISIVHDSTSDNLGPANSIPATGWSFITVTLSVTGNASTGYVNGEPGYTQGYVVDGFGGTNRTFRVGGRYDLNGNFYSGKLDDFRIYNRVLSPAEISALYKSGSVTNKVPSDLGLVGYWPMNEGTSTIVGDFSGNGNTGTMVSFPNPSTATSGWGNGKFGKGLSYSGGFEYVNVGNIADNLNAMTVSVWFKTTTVGPYLSLVTKIDERLSAPGWYFGIGAVADPNALTFFTQENGANYNQKRTVNGFSDGRWHHAVVTLSGGANGTIAIYVDGVNQSLIDMSGGTVASDTTTTNVWLGNIHTGTTFTGKLDDARIYNRALSPAEITTLYQGSKTRFISSSQNTRLTNGLVGLWSFNGPDVLWTSATAGIAYDRSGSNNTGTLTNMNRSTSVIDGKVGQALKFDGENNYIEVQHNSTLSLNNITLSAWIYLSTVGEQNIIDKRGIAALGGYNIRVQGASFPLDVDFIIKDPAVNDEDELVATGQISQNTWTYVVGTFDNNTNITRVYINGVQAVQGSSTRDPSNTPNSVPLRIGEVSGYNIAVPSALNFTGILDEARVYNRALTATEVKQLYNMGR